MRVKKRMQVPTAHEADHQTSFNIVKKPVPDAGKVVDVYGEDYTPQELRRLGLVAESCYATPPDEHLTVSDRFKLMRAVYDVNNPQEQRYRNRVRNRATAITAMCIVCAGGRKAVTECTSVTCPLWGFRFGGDPFYGKRAR